MGYAQINQRGHGIHTRQFARTFIVEDSPENRIVFVSVDAGMISHVVKRNVVRDLRKKYGKLYRMDNVMISGTRKLSNLCRLKLTPYLIFISTDTHSTPAGFHQLVLYDLTSLGFVKETFYALVRGITQSIINAHNNMFEGRIFISETEVQDANINRSPSAYANNSPEEKAQYKDNTDKTLVQLRFMDKYNKQVMGAFNWFAGKRFAWNFMNQNWLNKFAVHPTSMNNTNKFVSSDNVGLASLLLEQEYNHDQLVGKGSFVGAFCSSNLGDVSPNIKGPKCQVIEGHSKFFFF